MLNNSYYQIPGLVLFSVKSFFELNLFTLKQHIPGVDTVYGKEINQDVSFTFIESATPYLKENFKNGTLCVEVGSTLNSTLMTDVPHFMYTVLLKVLLRKELFCVHSVVINGHLFIGHSGSGKTQLASYALLRGLNVQSFDKSILGVTKEGKFKLLKGTDILSSRTPLTMNGINLKHETKDRFLYERLASLNKNDKEIKTINLLKVTNCSELIQIHHSIDSQIHVLFPYFIDLHKHLCSLLEGSLFYSVNLNSLDPVKLCHNLKNSLKNYKHISFLEGSSDSVLNNFSFD